MHVTTTRIKTDSSLVSCVALHPGFGSRPSCCSSEPQT